MGDIKFSCSRCSRHLAADASNAGQPVNCPECGNSLIIPTANQTPHNTDSAANTTSSEPVLKQYSETKSEIYKRQSFFQNLRLTFSIARQKTKRQLLESVDLRRAEINLGKTAIEEIGRAHV